MRRCEGLGYRTAGLLAGLPSLRSPRFHGSGAPRRTAWSPDISGHSERRWSIARWPDGQLRTHPEADWAALCRCDCRWVGPGRTSRHSADHLTCALGSGLQTWDEIPCPPLSRVNRMAVRWRCEVGGSQRHPPLSRFLGEAFCRRSGVPISSASCYRFATVQAPQCNPRLL